MIVGNYSKPFSHCTISIERSLALSFMLMLLGGGAARAQQPLEDQLRLKTGNYWVYAGTVAWSDVTAKNSYSAKKITWKTEILEKATRGNLKAYRVRGSFADLSWYEPEDKPGQYLWIIYQNRFYSLALNSDLLRRFHDPNDSLVSAVLDEEPVLQLPLRLNECTTELQPDEPRERDDKLYCWHMEKKQMGKVSARGVAENPVTQWIAWYRTMPEHHVLGFAPGVGIISYDFSHHGSIYEAHVKLAEAHLQ